MDYAQNAMTNHGAQAGAAIGNIKGTPVPRTIASAIGRIDGLNDRLSKARDQLTNISDQIGGPRAAGENTKPVQASPSTSAVSRLNDSAEYAHDYLSEIESLLASIGRALG